MRLREFQLSFLDAVTRPEPRDDAAGALVTPSASLSAAERLELYRELYWFRVRDVIADDFPGVEALLGADGFDASVRGYLAWHPPHSYTLADLGERYPEFLASSRGEADLLVELSRLELALAHCGEAEVTPVLNRTALAGVSPERWADARLRPSAGLALLRATHPVHQVLDEVRAGRPAPALEPEETFLLVWRRDFTVWRKPLTREAFTLLAALVEGLSLEDALARLGEEPDPGVVDQVFTWFAEWVEEGLFSAIELSPSQGAAP